MKKLAFVIILFTFLNSLAQIYQPGEVRGTFLSIGVGPRIPIGKFADRQNLGVGFDFEFSYTDNKIQPIFVYGKIGYEHYPGTQYLYKNTDYSSFSSNVLTVKGGFKYFFPPIVDQFILLMPVIEGGGSFNYFENYHHFKFDTGKTNYTEELPKYGFHVGGGISMFLMEVMAYYNYIPDGHSISFDLRVRIPIYVKY